MTVNALHVTGPAIDIVVASAQSGITCGKTGDQEIRRSGD